MGWRLLSSLLIVFSPLNALADGGVFISRPHAGEVQKVEVGAQRGLIWQKSDALEIWIEPVYAWSGEEGGAWVVPLPALPEVSEGDAALLDDLDALTAPTFVEVCWEPNCDCDCGWFGCVPGGGSTGSSADLSAGGGGTVVQDVLVTVWSSGSLSDLDYQVISSPSGDSVRDWLAANDYVVPERAGEALAAMETEGLYFFVARVHAPPEEGRTLAPVVFRLHDHVAPFYPVRLTAAVVAPDAPLDVTLWLLGQERLLPLDDDGAHALDVLPSLSDSDDAPSEYEAAVGQALQGMPAGGFVVTFDGVLMEERAYGAGAEPHPLDCSGGGSAQDPLVCEDAWGGAYCHGRCGRLRPLELGSDLKPLVRQAQTPYAIRLRGRLPAGQRDEDWRFGADSPMAEGWRRELAVYTLGNEDCWECGPCAGAFCGLAGGQPAAPGVVALLVILLAFSVGLTRRPRLRPPI